MSKWVFFVVLQWLFFSANSQSVDSAIKKIVKPSITRNVKDTSSKKVNKKDTLISTNKVITVKDTVTVIDSTKQADSLTLNTIQEDSIKQLTTIPSNKIDTSTYGAIFPVPQLPIGANPVYKIDKYYITANKDPLFYFFIGILLLLGFIRLMFNKYMVNIFTVFFQTSYRQKQLRDQLLQSKLASLLLNIFFVLVSSVYLCLLIAKNQWLHISFWWLLAYCSIIIAAVYTVKYLFLQFTGWIFNTPDATELYTFVVFLGNKIVAILLLPITIVLAFSSGDAANIALVISYFLLGIALAYRFIISLGVIRSDLNVSGLHFFLYLCSVEVLPLLLMYKAATNYIGLSY